MKHEITFEVEGLIRGKMIPVTYSISEWRKGNLHRVYVNDRMGKTVAYVDLTTHPMGWKWVKKTMASKEAEALMTEVKKAICEDIHGAFAADNV